MPDEKTTFEIALRDAVSPSLKAISRQLKEMNEVVAKDATPGTQSLDRLNRGSQLFAGTARQTVKEIAGMGSFLVGMGKGIVGTLGSVETLKQVSTALVTLGEQRVQLQMFSKDTRLSVEDIEKMQRGLERLGQTADMSKQTIAGLSTQLQELKALKESSSLFQTLEKMGGAGLAYELIKEQDYMKAIRRILEVFKKQGADQQFYLSQALKIPPSVLNEWLAAMDRAKESPKVNPQVFIDFKNHQHDLTERLENEWNIFGEHALSRFNQFFEELDKLGEIHLGEWGIHFFDGIDKILQQDYKDAQALLHLYQTLQEKLQPKAVNKALGDAVRNVLRGKRSGNRWDEDFGALEEQRKRLQKEDNKLLNDIRDVLKRMELGLAAGASAIGNALVGSAEAAPVYRPGVGPGAQRGDVSTTDTTSNDGKGELPPQPSPSGGETKIAEQSGHPYYLKGTVELGGKTYHYGSGGQGAGAIPYGDYPINIGKGDIGPIGQRIGSVATLGGPSGTFTGGGHRWAGVQIHRAFSDNLDRLYTLGCFSIAASEWPKFKQQLLEENAKHPEGLTLHVGRDGMASITPRGSTVELLPAHARDPTSTARPAVHPDLDPAAFDRIPKTDIAAMAAAARAATAAEKKTATSDSELESARNTLDMSEAIKKNKGASIKFNFNNVPSGTKTNAEADGMFTHVEVSHSKALEEDLTK
jgi:hypothetical protein